MRWPCQRRGQPRIVLVPDLDARSVECHEAAAALVDVDGPQAVVDQELPARGTIVDAEHEKVRSNDIHAFVSEREVIRGDSRRVSRCTLGVLPAR
jgi:hypothetical protein